MVQQSNRLVSVDSRPLRDVGNGTFGVSIDKDALRELGLVDDDGEISDDVSARQEIRENGEVRIELPVDE